MHNVSALEEEFVCEVEHEVEGESTSPDLLEDGESHSA